MSNFAIIRTTKLKSWVTLKKSVGHNLRTSNDDRSHLGPGGIKILTGSANWLDDWKKEVEGMHLRELAQGQSHTLSREFFLGMSPEWAEGKTRAEIDAWAADNIAWLEQRFGKERVKFAALHLDEQTPHIAAYVVPLKADLNRKGEPNTRGNGWTLSDSVLGLGGNKSALVKLQDQYSAAMQKFKLVRGIRGSKARHQTTAAWKGAMLAPMEKKIIKKSPDAATTMDRINIDAYAKRIADESAKAVYDQMKPYELKAKSQQKELRRLKTMVDKLEPIAEVFKAFLTTLLGNSLNLNTVEGITRAQVALNRILQALIPPEPEQAPAAEAIATKKQAQTSTRSTSIKNYPKPSPPLSR